MLYKSLYNLNSRLLLPTLNSSYFGQQIVNFSNKEGITDSNLEIFRRLLEKDSQYTDHNVHLDPFKHHRLVNNTSSEAQSENIPIDKQKSLNVSLLGVTNVGKSTLVNALCGYSACPYSSRTNTTKHISDAILSQSNVQIVFNDTPGLVNDKSVKKCKDLKNLEDLPEKSCNQADLIVVVQDVSNRYVREALDKKLLKILCRNKDIPSILVLNKIDTFGNEKDIYKLVRKLSFDLIDNKKPILYKKPINVRTKGVDDYVNEKLKEDDNENIKLKTNLSAKDFIQKLDELENNLSTENLKDLLKGVVGWPKFKDVYAVSAKEDKGIDNLKDFLISKAISRPWKFSDKLLSSEDPRKLVVNTIVAKILDVIPDFSARMFSPIIEDWIIDDGVLRISISIKTFKPHQTRLMLTRSGAILKAISTMSEFDLQNFFQCEVSLKINIDIQHKNKRIEKSQALNEKDTSVLTHLL